MAKYLLGSCSEEGLTLSAPWPHNLEYMTKLVRTLNMRAETEAAKGIFPNIVYWVQEVKDSNGTQGSYAGR
jgi:hypothetical protein